MARHVRRVPRPRARGVRRRRGREPRRRSRRARRVFGFGPRARTCAASAVDARAGRRAASRSTASRFTLPVPGAHNVENALAAIAACRALGVPLADDGGAARRASSGVGRRFQSLGVARGVEVVDDFAHNPAKIAAALAHRAAPRARRVLAIYQPHGYGPTRFLRHDFVETFATALGARRPAVDARGVLRRRHRAARLLGRRHRAPRSPRAAPRAEFAPSREWLVRAHRRRGARRRPGAGDGRARPVAHRRWRSRSCARAARGGGRAADRPRSSAAASRPRAPGPLPSRPDQHRASCSTGHWPLLAAVCIGSGSRSAPSRVDAVAVGASTLSRRIQREDHGLAGLAVYDRAGEGRAPRCSLS